jgi:Zn-dependent M28 family amino/carboxypeptidase
MMRLTAAALAFGLLLVGGCQPEPDTTAGGIDAAVDLIDEAALQAHLDYLASDELEGREAGEPGYDKAAAYVAEQFAAIGLEPAGDDGWYQQVPLISYRTVAEGLSMTLHRGNDDIPLTYREAFAVSGDPLREESEVRAELVYVGHGVHIPEKDYSDYEGVDVAGKIVVAFGDAPESLESTMRAHYASSDLKREEAVRRGAVGYIRLRSRDDEAKYPWAKFQDRIGKRASMTWLDSDGQPASYSPELLVRAGVSNDTAAKLFEGSPFSFEEVLDALEAGEAYSFALGTEVSMRQQSTHQRIESPNVIGMIRGTDPELADEYIVYTAHLDHTGVLDRGDEDGTYNGFYDNAMGIAMMLEAARALKAVPLSRSVLFVALTAEEKGLLGSEYFAEYPTVPQGAIVANINIDMPLFLYPIADLIAFGAQHSSLIGPAQAASEAEGFTLAPDPMPEENFFIRSDQYSFVKKGIPALYLDTGARSTDTEIDADSILADHLQNHYHEPSDDASRPVDWDSAVRFARANARVGHQVATEAGRPRWNEGDFFGDRFASK